MADLAGIEPAHRESKSRALTITLQAYGHPEIWVFTILIMYPDGIVLDF